MAETETKVDLDYVKKNRTELVSQAAELLKDKKGLTLESLTGVSAEEKANMRAAIEMEIKDDLDRRGLKRFADAISVDGKGSSAEERAAIKEFEAHVYKNDKTADGKIGRMVSSYALMSANARMKAELNAERAQMQKDELDATKEKVTTLTGQNAQLQATVDEKAAKVTQLDGVVAERTQRLQQEQAKSTKLAGDLASTQATLDEAKKHNAQLKAFDEVLGYTGKDEKHLSRAVLAVLEYKHALERGAKPDKHGLISTNKEDTQYALREFGERFSSLKSLPRGGAERHEALREGGAAILAETMKGASFDPKGEALFQKYLQAEAKENFLRHGWHGFAGYEPLADDPMAMIEQGKSVKIKTKKDSK